MPNLIINGKALTVEPGTTVLEAARLAGISIPFMCSVKGLPHFTSCMVCVVQNTATGQLLPSCSAMATEGLVVETHTEAVVQARAASLNLLMSEHAGDCEAPCTTTCPAHLKIPLMIRQLVDGQPAAALATIYDTIALPAVLGQICPAPCEKACRRGRVDAPLGICSLERFAADEASYTPPPPTLPTQKRIAIIGAGPTGLASAFYLAQAGHECTIFDERAKPGGQLRYGVPNHLLPVAVLERDIQRIHLPGVHFRMNTHFGTNIALQDLKAQYDAIIIATGKTSLEILTSWGLTATSKGIQIQEHSFRTSDEKIFAGGEAVQAGHLTVRAVAHGRSLAISINQFLKGLPVTGPVRRFESRLGQIKDSESQELLKEAAPYSRTVSLAGSGAGFSCDEALRESKRCMHCDCRKAESCKLRDYMEIQMAGPLHVPPEGRKPVERNITHPTVIFEPGKCIKCGICVRITAQQGESPGLAFQNRGFDATVGVPFGDSLEAALGHSAKLCVTECPTGALSWKDS